jgi:hypothetical protein
MGLSTSCGWTTRDAAETMPMVRTHARRTANEWRDDPGAAIEIEARLYRSGFDHVDINAEVFAQAGALFVMFDQLMQSAQSRHIGLRPPRIRRTGAPSYKNNERFVIVSLNLVPHQSL